jgi:hypothetical protein
MRPTKKELQAQLAENRDALLALQEWFNLSVRKADPGIEHTFTDYHHQETVITVRVLGLTRACGGVAIVTHGADTDEAFTVDPEYLDPLIARWGRTRSPYLQGAARKLRQLQTEANRLGKVS